MKKNSIDATYLNKEVQFYAVRITVGNPVTGIVTGFDDEWVTIKLTKDIEGLVNFWPEGSEKNFRLSLIEKLKIKK